VHIASFLLLYKTLLSSTEQSRGKIICGVDDDDDDDGEYDALFIA